MKLYMFPVAPNPTKVMLYLAEKKHAGTEIEIEQILVDFREKQQKSDDHLARNPMGKLPVLEFDDGEFLTESLPIIHYLEELNPTPPMIGTTPRERAETLGVERLAEQGFLYSMGRIVHATDSPLGFPPNPGVAEYYRENLIAPSKILDERLSDGRPFLMGDHVTIADCTLAAALQMGRMKQLEVDSTCPNIARWNAAYRERPAAKDVMLL